MKYLFSILLIVGLIPISFAQTEYNSIVLNKEFRNSKYEPREVKYIYNNSKNKLKKYNPLSLTLGGLMYFYQKVVSPQLSSNCPYEVSCSNFSVTAIRHFNLVKGVFLSADRLTRCSPFIKKDIDLLLFNTENKIIDSLSNYSLKKQIR